MAMLDVLYVVGSEECTALEKPHEISKGTSLSLRQILHRAMMEVYPFSIAVGWRLFIW